MRLKNIERSSNVEDRRRMTGGTKAAGGLGAIIMALIAIFVFKKDPAQTLADMNQKKQGASAAGEQREYTAEEKELKLRADRVLKLTEDVWNEIYPAASEKLKLQNARGGPNYVEPKLVVFTNQVTSGCGPASSKMGPFYCPADSKVYIDLAFFEELKKEFKAPGDFAQAYVIAHEVGHHVQNMLGYSGYVHNQRQRISKEQYNQLSVKLELQADFFAGVWAHRAEKEFQILERGDIEEGLRAAGAVGDDKIQKRMTGNVRPDLFTHGTAEQRIRWFTLGLKSGDPRSHNPFELEYDQL